MERDIRDYETNIYGGRGYTSDRSSVEAERRGLTEAGRRIPAETERRIPAETERRIPAETERRIPAEPERRISAETERRSPAEIERRRAARKKRRRKAMLRRVLAVIILFALLAGIVAAVFALKAKGFSAGGGIEGSFTREVDITQIVASKMALWLSDANKEKIDSKWVTERIEPYYLTENLELAKGSKGSGNSYRRYMAEDSINRMTQRVNEDAGRLLTEIIAKRLADAGYAENVTNEEADSLTRDALGMSAAEYILANGVSIAPTVEELNEAILDGESGQDGTYSITKGEMTVSVNGVETIEDIIRKKGYLIFTVSGRVYNEK